MVYYGPWQDSWLHTNTIHPRYPNTAARVEQGDDAFCGLLFAADGAGQVEYGYKLNGDVVTLPGDNKSGAAQIAWDNDQLVTVNRDDFVGLQTVQWLDVGYNDIFDQSSAAWDLWWMEYPLRLRRSSWPGPPSSMWPTGVIGAEVEDPLLRIVESATLFLDEDPGFYGPGEPFLGRYKEADEGGAWTSSLDSLGNYAEIPVGVGRPLSTTAMQGLLDDARLTGNTWDPYSARPPSFAFAPNLPYRLDEDFELRIGPFVFRVVVTFRTSRWRYIYDVPPYTPPRRIYPRDDGMTGGARRAWPPSKSQQWGNRVDGSGYV